DGAVPPARHAQPGRARALRRGGPGAARGRRAAGPFRRHRPDRGVHRRRPPRGSRPLLPPPRAPPEETLTVTLLAGPLTCLSLLLAAPPAQTVREGSAVLSVS